MHGELSFFELGVGDADRARVFYSGLFGWEFVDEGAGATIETPNIPGGLHGGDPGSSPYLFFRVDDLDAALERVRQLGGEVGDDVGASNPDTISRFGRFVLCKDDQGSGFGLHQPPHSLGVGMAGEAATWLRVRHLCGNDPRRIRAQSALPFTPDA